MPFVNTQCFVCKFVCATYKFFIHSFIYSFIHKLKIILCQSHHNIHRMGVYSRIDEDCCLYQHTVLAILNSFSFKQMCPVSVDVSRDLHIMFYCD